MISSDYVYTQALVLENHQQKRTTKSCRDFINHQALFPSSPAKSMAAPNQSNVPDAGVIRNHKKWSPEEEEALRAGVARHGFGSRKWKAILNDPDFSPILSPHRSNIDLKDKWRNLLGTTPRHLLSQSYNDIILEAISSNKDTKMADFDSIASYFKRRSEGVPGINFRTKLIRRLRKLVSQDKLEQRGSFYRIKETTFELPKDNDVRQYSRENIKAAENSSQPEVPSEEIESCARYAASMVAEAEHKSSLAAEAVKEAERISEMAEETEALLQLAKAIYEQCSMGNIVLID